MSFLDLEFIQVSRWVCTKLLADDGSEMMGFGNLLHLSKYEDTGVQCYSRMHNVKATALL